MKPGKFITFEGGEGVGKSTQAQLLAERLRKAGHEVVLTREPGGTERGEQIREFLLSGRARFYGPMGEAILFSSAREEHVRDVISPALNRGSWVLCDRFADSTAAYQGAAGGVKPATLHALERVAVGETAPDLTFILDVPPETGLERAAERAGSGKANGEAEPDRFEGMEKRFHEALRTSFLQIAAQAPERCVVIDAKQSEEEVAGRIWDTVVERLRP